MQKILVSLNVPSVFLRVDLYIPTFLKVSEIIPMLIEAVKEITNSHYYSSGVEVLCSEEKNIILPNSKTLNQCGVLNGEHLILL